MKIEEIDARIKELGRLLNSDNVERQQKGAFSEASEEVKKAYRQKLVDMQAEQDALFDLKFSLQDAAPEVGEKLIANFINLYPMGKRSSAGIGSLLGKELGGVSEAEMAKIAQAEAEVVKFDQIARDGEPLTGAQKLQQRQAQGIMNAKPSKAGAMTTEEYFEKISDSGKDPTSPQMLDDFLKYQESKGRTKIGGIWFTREQWERLMDEDFSDIEAMSEAEIDLIEKYNLEGEQLPKGPPKELNFNTQEMKDMSTRLTQYVEDLVAKTPLSDEDPTEYKAGGYVEAPSSGVDAKEIAKRLNQVIFEKEYNPDISIAQNFEKIVDAARNKGEYKSKDFDPLGISSATQLKRYSVSDEDKPKLKAILGNTSLEDVASQYDAPLIGEYDVKQHLLNFLIEKQGSYKAGGYVMNYGDYGRSYK